MKTHSLLTAIVFLASTPGLLAGGLVVADLKCEYRTAPVGVDSPAPRLGWLLASGARGARQTGYQLLVSSTPEILGKDQGDLWDSGKVPSNATQQIVYQGKPLVSRQPCHWKVRVWDQDGGPSAWSAPARWIMGLMSPADWQAKWIGSPPPEVPSVDDGAASKLSSMNGQSWMWANATQAGGDPAREVYFRKEITLAEGKVLRSAFFRLAADDTCQVYVNGKEVDGPHRNSKVLAVRFLNEALKPGRNIIGVKASHAGKKPAGLIGRLEMEFENAEPITSKIDATWVTSTVAAADWSTLDHDPSSWKPAAAIEEYGGEIWGRPFIQKAQPAPYFRKEFGIARQPARATLHVTALGVFEMRINGRPVSEDVLAPGWTDYRKRLHYHSYDVTSLLCQGRNVLAASVGDGWYAGFIAFTGRRHYYGGNPRLLSQLHIEYADGSSEVIVSDGSWKTAYGPIREADLQGGCVYDMGLEFPGWDAPGFDDVNWKAAIVDSLPQPRLLAHPGEPMRRMRTLAAQAVSEPIPGHYVFDLGQNIVGWARVKLDGPAGGKVRLRHAEMLNPDGTLYLANLRSAAATDTFILDGNGPRELEPCFTFHGFRYLEISGLSRKPALEDVKGIVVHSAIPRAGWFECSEPLVNKLAENSLWGQMGNFLDLPTDCPQRDERAGWTGDAQVFMKTSCLNMDCAAFYSKWIRDLCEDSQHADGGFGDTAPMLDLLKYGNTGWSDAGPICVWRMFEMYGDSRVLREQYPALLQHQEFLSRTANDHSRGTGNYGDWLRLKGPQHSEVIGTAYYAHTTRIMAQIAGALGESADARRFLDLYQDIRAAFIRKYIRSDGRIEDEKQQTGQTFYSLAFGIDLVPDNLKTKVAGQFAAALEQEQGHIATGFLGTPFILFALEKAGRLDLAWKLALNQTYPSWLQQVRWGSTTMWERWDGWHPERGFQDPGMNSFNHYWLGCINEWLFTRVAGIDTTGPGFRDIVISPLIGDAGCGFDWVKAKYHSIHGPIQSAWKRDEDGFSLSVSVPANGSATISIPASTDSHVTESGKSAAESPCVRFLRQQDGRSIYQVDSGDYHFTSRRTQR